MTPKTEYSEEFWRGMVARMGISFHKYGPVKDTHENNPENVRQRLKAYAETGNTEYLMDAANYCMMEFMHPVHPNAHFTPTDDDGSPGIVLHGSSKPRRNVDNQGERIVG